MRWLIVCLLLLACSSPVDPVIETQEVVDTDCETIQYVTLVIDVTVDPPVVRLVVDSVKCIEDDI